MHTATSETESKSRDLSKCVHHYTLRAPCPKGQGTFEYLYLRVAVFFATSTNVNLYCICWKISELNRSP